jgi:two-component system, LuxR family, sensor kinase FixL
MFSSLLGGSTKSVLFRAGLLIAAIAIADWLLVDEMPLGILYILPMLMVGRVLRPWLIASVALLCTVLAELFDPFVWHISAGITRDILYFSSFFCVGLFVYEVSKNRQIVLGHLHEIERQSEARREAEEQLKVLIESSPAAIITTDTAGSILQANEAAHRLLALATNTLPGRAIGPYFPALATLLHRDSNDQLFRAVMTSRAQRDDGEVFLAEICFSTYRTNSGLRLAAMILDSSEELRSREEASLHQMLTGSRIAVGAVSHEIRNVCGAIAVVHQNLARTESLGHSEDFAALGSLVLALERIASVDLRQSADQATEVDLNSVLDDLRIVIAPALREENINATWTMDEDLPLVWADRTTLMQVFLNLTTNSRRVLSRIADRDLSIIARRDVRGVVVDFIDNGGGVKHPELLFHPFQDGAHANGLGLYLSRAFMRSLGGELRYRPVTAGTCFTVELSLVNNFEGVH